MKANHEMLLKANYKIHKASDNILAMILSEISWRDVSMFLDVFGKLKKAYHQRIPQLLATYDWKYKENVYSWEWHNLVPFVLRYELATLISWTTVTPTFKANYIAMGDDSTAPNNNDTQLWNETIRWAFSDRFAIDNVAYLDKFWSSAEVGWNSYQEIGVFVDGTWSANTWYLLSHISINENMWANETLTINCSFTIA